DAPEVLEIDGDDAHQLPLRVTLEQGSLDAIDEEQPVGKLGQRIVKRTVGELGLERTEREQRVMEAAALDRQGDEVGEVLKMPVVGAGDTTFGGAHPQRKVSDRPRPVAKGDREAARDPETAAE